MQEALHRERDRIRTRRAPRPAGKLQRQLGLCQPEIGHQQGREFFRRDIAAADRTLAARRERDEVIVPGGQLAGLVDAALERMKAADPIEVMLHVVFARPLQFYRYAGLP